MKEFIPGQRWISDSELQMGLGTVLTTEHRTVTIVFLATGETRTYAKQTAPLSRVVFSPGDKIRSHEGWYLKVESVHEENGLLSYSGAREDGSKARLDEGQLDNLMQLNRPSERLFTRQIDPGKWFKLRYETIQHANRLIQSPLRGLTGGRTSLIPHQLYIAHEVASRYAPRVLLADEVGLGKTIEAGMIVHQQLLTEQAQRVLIVVPETLVHQWLVEMLRRFNLPFSIFDEERCLAMTESDPDSNPFLAEQQVLCSLRFLLDHPARLKQALDAQWDLLVVDEAHHLAWEPGNASPEYQAVEALANNTKGVLLLTATPEQLGKESHFARLRLLDADRFPGFETFVREEQAYGPIARAIEELFDNAALSESSQKVLSDALHETDNLKQLAILSDPNTSIEARTAASKELIDHLLDRHGTGRVLFRNTRAAVKGFPQRQVMAYPLPLPEAYRQCIVEAQATSVSNPQLLLSTERLYQAMENPDAQPWMQCDPRLAWLQQQIKSLKPEKILVITSNAQTALDIVEALRVTGGIHAAVFHEGMSIVERDRAAAFFADKEYGSQVMVCSEIGSEGRNFQFAHHLVLFDLPLNPDLLEQRIGRLDRIGQTEDIQIHIPYLQNSAQEVMYRWYHEGLGAFEHTCPAGQNVFAQLSQTLIETLHQVDSGLEDLPELLKTTQLRHQELNNALQQGRDRLLEFNSCRPEIAQALADQAKADDAHSALDEYMNTMFDCYGVDSEDHSEGCLIIRPSDEMQTSAFPGLQEDGMTITFDRNIALSFEDTHFISWEHPMVTGAIDLVLSSELGNTAVTAMQHKGMAAGKLLLECLFIVEPVSQENFGLGRYLPVTSLRVVIDQDGRDISTNLPHDIINQSAIMVDKETSVKIVKSQEALIRRMLDYSEQHANQQANQVLQEIHQRGSEALNAEINRLMALKKVNPNIRTEEIEFFESRHTALAKAVADSTPRLDAMRIIVTT